LSYQIVALSGHPYLSLVSIQIVDMSDLIDILSLLTVDIRTLLLLGHILILLVTLSFFDQIRLEITYIVVC